MAIASNSRARLMRGRAGKAALLLAAALALVAGAQKAASAADEVFTVGNYPVEARADNAVTAKTKAMADGQQSAFRSLLKRLVPVTAYQRLRQLPPFPAGDLVEGVKVRSERNSSTDYIANLDFSFQSKGVRDLLRREGIPFTDEQAPALTLVPLWRSGASTAPKGEAAWTNVWKGLDLEHALTPVKLQPLKKEIAPDAVNALAEGNGSAIRALVAAYGSELVLLAVAEQDLAARRLNVTLTGRDAVGAFMLRRAYRLDAADPGYTSELAAVVSLGIIEGRWKAIKSPGGGGAVAKAASGDSDLLIAVEFRGMSEWQDISRKLSATPGIEELEVAGLSARGARVTLRYAEGAERLADALARQGLNLRNTGGNWVLGLQ
jgi:Uncharacterized protein conserved in bacteria (DUF2066)